MIPHEVIDRPKGYFPVPALTHLEGPLLDIVRDALTDPAAKQRGPVRAGLRRPPAGRAQRRAHARCGGNKLWQLGLLELWLQTHGVGA